MSSSDPAPVTSQTRDLPFVVLRWVSLAALVALAYMGAVDAMRRDWLAFATSVILLLLVLVAIARPALGLAQSLVTVDSAGIRRRGGWELAWWDVAQAEVRIHKDIQYLVVVPRTPPRSMDLTRFFLRRSEFPKEAFVAPVETHRAPEIRDAIRYYKKKRAA